MGPVPCYRYVARWRPDPWNIYVYIYTTCPKGDSNSSEQLLSNFHEIKIAPFFWSLENGGTPRPSSSGALSASPVKCQTRGNTARQEEGGGAQSNQF